MILPDRPHTLIELANTANPVLLEWFQNLTTTSQYPILGNILIIDQFAFESSIRSFAYPTHSFETSNITAVVQMNLP